jgi:hypothetical protein
MTSDVTINTEMISGYKKVREISHDVYFLKNKENTGIVLQQDSSSVISTNTEGENTD